MRAESKVDRTPAYVHRWVGQRVSWGEGGPDQSGLVLDAKPVIFEYGKGIGLTVARADGFIEYGIDIDKCDRIAEEIAQP